MSAINEIKAKDGVDQKPSMREADKYKYGWDTEIEMEYAPKGVNQTLFVLSLRKTNRSG